MKKTLSVICALLILPFTAAQVNAVPFNPNNPHDPGINIGATLAPGFEPSGLVWIPRLNSFFVVWDNGFVAQLQRTIAADQSQQWNTVRMSGNLGCDLEGITVVDDQSNHLYLLCEYPQKIVEFDIDSFALTTVPNTNQPKVWNLQGMEGTAARGAEALTYNSARREFYVGSQFDGKIYMYSLDLNAPGNVAFSRFIDLHVDTDIAGLTYMAETQTTYAVFDAVNVIKELNANDEVVVDGAFDGSFDAPGVDQEGIALMPGCPGNFTQLVIAQDSGGVMLFNNYPIRCPAAVVPPVDPAQPPVDPVPQPPVEPVPPAEPTPPANPVPPAQPVQQRPDVQLGVNSIVKIVMNLLTPGPGTVVKSNMHLYDAKGEYSSLVIPAQTRATNFRVEIQARATAVDAQYPLSVTTQNVISKGVQSQMVNSTDWKTYTYQISVPANTPTELRVVSGVLGGLTRAGVKREHQVRGVSFTRVEQNLQIKMPGR